MLQKQILVLFSAQYCSYIAAIEGVCFWVPMYVYKYLSICVFIYISTHVCKSRGVF